MLSIQENILSVFCFFSWKIPASITIRDCVLKALVTALTVIKRFIKTVTETYAKVLCADAKLAASSLHILKQALLQLTGVRNKGRFNNYAGADIINQCLSVWAENASQCDANRTE